MYNLFTNVALWTSNDVMTLYWDYHLCKEMVSCVIQAIGFEALTPCLSPMQQWLDSAKSSHVGSEMLCVLIVSHGVVEPGLWSTGGAGAI